MNHSTSEYEWFYRGIVRKDGEIEMFEPQPLNHGHNLRPGQKVPTELAQKLTKLHLGKPENQGLVRMLKIVSDN